MQFQYRNNAQAKYSLNGVDLVNMAEKKIHVALRG